MKYIKEVVRTNTVVPCGAWEWAVFIQRKGLTSDDATGGHGGPSERVQVGPAVEDVVDLVRRNGEPRCRCITVGLTLAVTFR